MFEAYGKNKYNSHRCDSVDAEQRLAFDDLASLRLQPRGPTPVTSRQRKACEPLHIQYSYDDQSIVVVNSTYQPSEALHASVTVHNPDWKQLYAAERTVDSAADSAQRIFSIPASLYTGADRLFLIDLKLADKSGSLVSRNFYWVPVMLTSFDWQATDFTHTPALRNEDMTPLADLPKVQLNASAELQSKSNARVVQVRLENPSKALAFQVSVAARTSTGGLVAPVLWSDNWIELMPGESITLIGQLPESAPADTVIQLSGWNIAPQTLSTGALRATSLATATVHNDVPSGKR